MTELTNKQERCFSFSFLCYFFISFFLYSFIHFPPFVNQSEKPQSIFFETGREDSLFFPQNISVEYRLPLVLSLHLP